MCVSMLLLIASILFLLILYFYIFFINSLNNLNLQVFYSCFANLDFGDYVCSGTTLSSYCNLYVNNVTLLFFIRWCWSWLRWLGRTWSSMIWYYSSCGRCSCAHGTCTTAPCVLSCSCPFMTSTSVRSVQSTPVTRCGTSFSSVLGNTPFQLQHNCHNSPFVGSFHFIRLYKMT